MIQSETEWNSSVFSTMWDRVLLFVSMQRAEERAEVCYLERESEWRDGYGGEIRFIRGGEQEQSLISILTLPLDTERNCHGDKVPVQSSAMPRILINL